MIGAISFLGITLGVATLIIVMAVMNGFRQELLTRILGVSGQVVVEAADTPLGDYEDLSALFELVVRHVPAPKQLAKQDEPFQMLSEQFSSLAFSIALSTYSLSSTSMIV